MAVPRINLRPLSGIWNASPNDRNGARCCQNLGHQSMVTTELSYGVLDHASFGEVLSGPSVRQPVDDLIAELEAAKPGVIDVILPCCGSRKSVTIACAGSVDSSGN